MTLPNQIDPLFLGPSSGTYSIGHSLRFRSSASAYLNRTYITSATNLNIQTYSCWVKRGSLGVNLVVFGGYLNSSNYITLYFNPSNQIEIDYNSVGITSSLITTQVFRDPSSWYHVVFAYDSTQGTASNREKLYVNGVQVTSFSSASYPSQNQNSVFGFSGSLNQIGSFNNASFFDGYMAETNFIDGQALTPSSFGAYDTNGVWQPKQYTGTYGTNGFYLPFSNGTSTTTLGYDFSGNSNNWTTNNISLTAGNTYDSMLDVPTNNSATAANFCVLNTLNKGTTQTVSNGNLTSTASSHGTVLTSIGVTSGKWYGEATLSVNGGGGIGFTSNQAAESAYSQVAGKWWCYDNNASFNIINQGTAVGYSSRFTAGQVWQWAIDNVNGKVWIGVNNAWLDSTNGITGNPATGANPTFTFTAGTPIWPFLENPGSTWNANFGQQAFTYTPPTGFSTLNTYNLPTPTILNGAQYMASTLYTGTGATATISNGTNNTIGTTFQPDFVWIKSRSAATNNNLFDVRRGTTAYINSNTTAISATNANTLTAFGSTGFTLGSDASAIGVNVSAATYDAWQWKASNSSGVTNTSGSITSTVSANTTAGFSIVTYTGTGANATVGHGLGVAPNMLLIKKTSGTTANWAVYHSAVGNTAALSLNQATGTNTTAAFWQNTTPTSTVFSIGTSGDNNASGTTQVAYCFAAVAGYSAFGSYTGNGSTDGPFVYLGFRPRFVMIKIYSTTGDWYIYDTSRQTSNVMQLELYPDASAAETNGGDTLDILSNGFKLRTTQAPKNASGATYAYAAFAENSFTMSRAR